MANAAPPPPPPPSRPLHPPARPTAAASAPPPEQLATAVAVNSFRLGAVADRLSAYFQGSIPLGNPELYQLYYALARGIDYALSSNDVPPISHRLPVLLKKVYQRRGDSSLQPALMVLFVSAKSACANGWFQLTDREEILSMAKEVFSSLCLSTGSMIVVGNALDTISKIMSRYYPLLKLGHLVVSFEVKRGYNILMTDFHIQRNIPPDERIRLFISETDNLETSSCIISPSQVSFLINGKGVERRTNVSLDTGPQFPTDITRMLKYGTNIIQAIGYFSGNYMIAIAFMSKLTSFSAPILEDYVQPAVAELASDAEIVEGPSRVSLSCPISFKRIKTPVRGHLCKHHQCFDYDNYMEINSRKPSWRCPCCNTPISIPDLRIDQNMVKILQEVGDDIADIVISASGSWKIVVEQNGSTNQMPSGIHTGCKDGIMESDANALPDVMDLTMEEDDESTMTISSTQLEPSLWRPANLGENTAVEMEDRKPIIDHHGFVTSDLLSNPPTAPSISTSMSNQEIPYRIGENDLLRDLSSTSGLNGSFSSTSGSNGPIAPVNVSSSRVSGTLSSLVPDAVLNPVTTDILLPAVDRGTTVSVEFPQSTFSFQPVSHARQLSDNLQLQQLNYGDSMISDGGRRPPIPRHVSRLPIAVQALPVPTETPSSSRRVPRNMICYASTIPIGSSSASLPSLHSTDSPDRFCVVGDMGLEQMPRTFNAAASSLQLNSLQNRDCQDQQTAPSGMLQQAVGLPALNQTGTRTLPEQLIGVGAYRASLPLPSEHQTTNQILNQMIHRSTTQSQASRVPSMQVSQASQNAIGATVESSEGHLSVLFAAQHGRLLADGTTIHSPTAYAPSSTTTADRSRTIQFACTDDLAELPPEQNWRPSGRMRGSLIGDAYSAALNHYLPLPTQSTQAQPAVSIAGSNPSRLPSLISSSTNPHALAKQQATTRHGDGSNLQGGSNR